MCPWVHLALVYWQGSPSLADRENLEVQLAVATRRLVMLLEKRSILLFAWTVLAIFSAVGTTRNRQSNALGEYGFIIFGVVENGEVPRKAIE